MREFNLPSLGADMDKGTLIEWRVRPGDVVKRGQVVAVVDTTKAAIDVECWEEGTVDTLLAAPQTELPVGAPMLLLREPGETPEQVEQWKRARRAATPKPAAGTAAPAHAETSRAAPPVPVPSAESARRRIAPGARKHAVDAGIDLGTIAGTGPQGAVTLENVERAVAHAVPTAPDHASEMRKTIAAAMARAKREIPHYYLATEIPLAAATRWLAAENEKRSVTERLVPAVLLIGAVARALEKYPELNGFYRGGRFEPSAAVHVGVAISLRHGGLIAPAILDANTKTPDQLMRDLTDLVKRARSFSLKSSEISGPTVTVTNLGDQGVDSVFGVIYPPQVAILGFGSPTERAHVVAGEIRAVPIVTASLSADHRVSDGHRGALFLRDLKALLQQPERL